MPLTGEIFTNDKLNPIIHTGYRLSSYTFLIDDYVMSKDNIKDLLLTRNANPVAVDDFIALTENCEIARYAPSSSATIQKDYDKAVSIISDLEKQI